MVVRVVPPRCRMWNFQLNNHWMESLDYRHHPVHTNSSLATPDADGLGGYTIVVAHDGDGRSDEALDAASMRGATRLTTAGHECGTMCFRCNRRVTAV